MLRTIGEILKAAREKKKLTLDEATKQTKIHLNYIRAMENNDYRVFSSRVHSRGFLKIYAQYLGLNADEILALWRREFEKNFDAIDKRQFNDKKFKPETVFTITPSSIFAFLGIVSLFAFFAYLFVQYKQYTGVPKLDIFYPTEDTAIETEVLDITGKTDLDSTIYINSHKIVLNPDGSFAESISLKEGLNTISIKAVNKLNKESEVVRTVIYRPKKIEPEVSRQTTETVETTPSLNDDTIDTTTDTFRQE